MKPDYFEMLKRDVRFIEGLHACINCGTCTAICPAAEFYNYDPRFIADTVQSRDNQRIEELLKSETIWYCAECMSCKTRCPKSNTPGYIIQALRHLSHETGFFTESEKGRQSLAIKRKLGEEILRSGYCVHIDRVTLEDHPEQGPVWEWLRNHPKEAYAVAGANYQGESGTMRKIPDQALQELKSIFDVTGCSDFFEHLEKYSEKKAVEMGLQFDSSTECEYIKHVYTANNGTHSNDEMK